MPALTSPTAILRWQQLSMPVRLVLALCAGGLTPLALAPLSLWPLALLTPAALAWLCWRQPPRTILFSHFSFGIGLFGVGASWVFVSIHNFGHAPLPLAVIMTALFVAFLSAVFTLNALLLSTKYIRQQPSLALYLLSFCSIWVLGEWLRSWLLTGFPWLYIGYSQWQTALAGWAPVTGVLGISMAAAMTGCACLYALHTPPIKAKAASLLLIASLWLGGGYLHQTAWTTPAGNVIDIALVQANIPQEKKWQADFLQPSLQRYRDLSKDAWNADWVIWPEAAVPMLYHRATPFLEEMHQRAVAHNAALITGILYDDPFQRKIYNSVTGLGQATGIYHKTRLVPFGEYVPLENWLRGLIEFFNLPMSVITAGEAEQSGIQVGGTRIASAICYEIVYPDLVASSSRNKDIILTISNDAWFGASWGPLQHLEMAQMRALETGRYVVRGTNNGISAIVTPAGKIAAQSDQFVQQVLRGKVNAMQGDTPFMRWGSWPVVILCVIFLLGVAFAPRLFGITRTEKL